MWIVARSSDSSESVVVVVIVGGLWSPAAVPLSRRPPVENIGSSWVTELLLWRNTSCFFVWKLVGKVGIIG
jgi:hypothetical protein